VLLKHLWRAQRTARVIGQIARTAGVTALCVNSENMLLAPRAGRIARCPVTVIMRGMRLMELGLAGEVYIRIQRRWVDRYVALTRRGAEALADKGVPASKLRVVPNGVDGRLYAPAPRDQALAADLGVGAEDLVIGTISHLTPRKGVHHLIAALGRLDPDTPAYRVVILGHLTDPSDAPYATEIHRQIERLGLSERVRLLGYRDDVARMLSLFDLVVHPSETENFPRSMIEAQAAGKAIVGFRVGGMPEVVADGQSGILVAPFDEQAMAAAISRLLKNPEQRKRMGELGRRRTLEQFDLGVTVTQLLRVILGHE
jgi:glycosyltransferase involved in cell wall biosynthesis